MLENIGDVMTIACYGISKVPEGDWFCRKCQSEDKNKRVRCELCPSKDGAFKRTVSGGWAHVICGLYHSEVNFMDTTLMEPIDCSGAKNMGAKCYICDQHGMTEDAEAEGLLWEVTKFSSTPSGETEFVGYCPQHMPNPRVKGSRAKKKPFMKQLNAFRPIPHDKASPQKHPPPGSLLKLVSSNHVGNSSEDTPSPLSLTTNGGGGGAGPSSKGPSPSASVTEPVTSNGGGLSMEAGVRAITPLTTPPISPHPAGATVKKEELSSSAAAYNEFFGVSAATAAASGVGDVKLFSPDDLLPEDEGQLRDKGKKSHSVIESSGAAGFSGSGARNKSPSSSSKKRSRHHSGHHHRKEKKARDSQANAQKGSKSIVENGFVATSSHHSLLGNELNLNSSMISDIAGINHTEAGIDLDESLSPNDQKYVGPSLPRRSTSTSFLGAVLGKPQQQPQTLEDLCEFHWTHSAQLLMEDAERFDISKITSDLYKLRADNEAKERRIVELEMRRNRLLAENARLTTSLATLPPLQSATSSVSGLHHSSSHHVPAPPPPLPQSPRGSSPLSRPASSNPHAIGSPGGGPPLVNAHHTPPPRASPLPSSPFAPSYPSSYSTGPPSLAPPIRGPPPTAPQTSRFLVHPSFSSTVMGFILCMLDSKWSPSTEPSTFPETPSLLADRSSPFPDRIHSQYQD
ncbi:unnamed protein product [Cyprideis torosa]|uniref:Uncharacterized protein n=1 Tax=Cyprideis torosa TaxID=163714 RepID=A0A7R8WBE4_9CRUS|nr:unnamed protein product [Cyprideis torosa]CAG0886345.1 unnamed protein product [Cyprideis torosa]